MKLLTYEQLRELDLCGYARIIRREGKGLASKCAIDNGLCRKLKDYESCPKYQEINRGQSDDI